MQFHISWKSKSFYTPTLVNVSNLTPTAMEKSFLDLQSLKFNVTGHTMIATLNFKLAPGRITLGKNFVLVKNSKNRRTKTYAIPNTVTNS